MHLTRSLRTPFGLAAIVVGTALLAWIVTAERMAGMEAGPGAALGSFSWYVGVWVTMMAAMMLPSVVPMVIVFSKVSQERMRRGRAHAPTWVFLGGYLAAWTIYGVLAYAAYRLIDTNAPSFLQWGRQGPLVAGAAISLAGLYQLTPLKAACLKHCRGPMHFVLQGWRPGWLGALRMGLEHGLYCVGCCWGLMLVLFGVGVMTVFWMAVIAALIFIEKVGPFAGPLRVPLATTLIAFGIWVAIAPSSVPNLNQHHTGRHMQMTDSPTP